MVWQTPPFCGGERRDEAWLMADCAHNEMVHMSVPAEMSADYPAPVSRLRARPADIIDVLTNSLLYRRHLAEREEILRHKWIESEKVGFDIGVESARVSWIIQHQASWRKAWRSRHM